MRKGWHRQKREQRVSALEQIRALFDAAAVAFVSDHKKAKSFVEKAHRLVLKNKVRLPSVLKRRYCKKCRSLWVPGKSVKVRLTKGRLVYTCQGCKRIYRTPL